MRLHFTKTCLCLSAPSLLHSSILLQGDTKNRLGYTRLGAEKLFWICSLSSSDHQNDCGKKKGIVVFLPAGEHIRGRDLPGQQHISRGVFFLFRVILQKGVWRCGKRDTQHNYSTNQICQKSRGGGWRPSCPRIRYRQGVGVKGLKKNKPFNQSDMSEVGGGSCPRHEIPLGVLPGDFTLSRSQLRKNADLPVGSS